ncbi:MAG: proline--tRNA ligase, partial [Spirochaetes bacterium]|nr:proline--tRNA ligase [Spirochaetota bacterium]
NVNPDRDFKVDAFFDIRTVKEGDTCEKCPSKLIFKRGIEVGHIFKLGYKYTKSMDVKFLDKDHKEKHPIMGCYGIGVDRTIAAIIEQSHDKDGIIWPITTSPFELIIIPIVRDNEKYRKEALSVYEELSKEHSVLMDDREYSPGYKFKDADLLGIPLKLILSEKNLAAGKVELKWRRTGESILVPKEQIVPELNKYIKEEYKKYEV